MSGTMKFTTTTIAFVLACSSVAAFTPQKASTKVSSPPKSSIASDLESKPIFDPLGLYGKNAPERKEGKIQPLENVPNPDKTVKDPMNLYSDKAQVDDKPMSASLPFLKRPAMLDGTLPGDRGFDPFNFASDENALQWYRIAEVKHARLAMLATAGWALSELFDKKLAAIFDLQPLLDLQDRVPSVLNGGLDRTPGAFWAATLGVAFAIETLGVMRSNSAGLKEVPGDLGFDPLNLAGSTVEERKFKMEAELFNGRLAMLAITSFALQEWWYQTAVINQTPIFFKPINVALEQLQDAAGNGF